MGITHWKAPAMFTALLLACGSVQAQQDKAAPLEGKSLDLTINRTLRDVINTGADLFNPPVNDHAGCYRLYQGALMAVRALLDHRPDLQKTIDSALTDADNTPSIPKRAHILRRAIDRVRSELAPKKDAVSLWDRLGGEKAVRKVVDDFVELAANDPKVDFTRGGKYKFTEAQLANLKQKLVEMVSQASGGPLKYSGKNMKEVHKGMGISDAQFNALAADLQMALDKNGVKPADRDAALQAVGATRPDIVEKIGHEK